MLPQWLQQASIASAWWAGGAPRFSSRCACVCYNFTKNSRRVVVRLARELGVTPSHPRLSSRGLEHSGCRTSTRERGLSGPSTQRRRRWPWPPGPSPWPPQAAQLTERCAPPAAVARGPRPTAASALPPAPAASPGAIARTGTRDRAELVRGAFAKPGTQKRQLQNLVLLFRKLRPSKAAQVPYQVCTLCRERRQLRREAGVLMAAGQQQLGQQREHLAKRTG